MVLLAGFTLAATPPLEWLFGKVAQAIAVVSAFLLQLAGNDLVRTGIELRDRATGHAIAVTSACDGHGLLIAAMALWTWMRTLTPARRDWAAAIGFAVGTILLFNLARILGLFLSLGTSWLMALQHLYLTPLASVLLVALVALYGRRLSPWRLTQWPLVWLALALLAAAAWYPLQLQASCALPVPLANGLLWLNPGPLVHGIVCAGAEVRVATSALLSQTPLTFLSVPFAPADFMLATPLLAASLAAALAQGRRPGRIIAAAAISLLLMVAAMAIGALTSVHDQAIAADVRYLLGEGYAEAYHAPHAAMLAALKAIQNVLVHFNLFVLPFVVLTWAGRPRPAPSTPHARTRPRRRRR